MKKRIKRILGMRETLGGTCDMCGTGLKYIVTVELDNNSILHIGRDCASKHYYIAPCDRKFYKMTARKYNDRRRNELESTIRGLKQSINAGNGDAVYMADYYDSHIAYIARWQTELESLETYSK